MSWTVQSVLGIDTAAQTMRLNTYLRTSWRDWRLAYAEGGAPPVALASPPAAAC